MSKLMLLLLPIMAAAHACAEQGAKNWVEIQGPHFTIITDSSEKDGRRIGAQVEQMRAILREAYPQFESDPESPIVILAVKDRNEFRNLEPKAYLSKGALTLHGMFLRVSDENYILMRLDSEGGNPYPIVYHEYTHLLLSALGDMMPLWLNEGLAEFYEGTEIHDRDVVLGKLIPRRLELLRQEKLLPLPTLFTVDDKSPYYLEEKRGSLFYAESWALTRYLKEKDYWERTSAIESYMKLLSGKTDPVTAGVRAFGDLKKLQKALEAYIQQPGSDFFRTTIRARISDSEFDSVSLSSTRVKSVEADFLVHYGRLQEASALVDEVLRQEPGDSSVQQTKAFLEAARDEQVEKELQSAIDRNPSSAAAYDRLAVFLWQHSRNLDRASALESKAISMEPNNVEYRINLGNILLGMGRSQAGVEMLRTAAALAKTPTETERTKRLLDDASAYLSAQLHKPNTEIKSGTAASNGIELAPDHDHVVMPRGPHRFLTGVIQEVHCDPPNLEARVVSQGGTLTLHAKNYYKIEFTALFKINGDLDPCKDLENRRARVEYVESADGSDSPSLIAVELQK